MRKSTPVPLLALAAALSALACQSPKNADTAKPQPAPATDQPAGGAAMSTLAISSSAFAPDGEIPAAHTCEGADESVPLSFAGAPAGTKSLALIVDDPDAPDPQAPKMVWVHWVLYNLPPDATGLAAGVTALPTGTLEGLNDWKRTGYGGPCPPIGRHRYFHKLYALDTLLPDLGQPTKDQLLAAMEGHVLAEAQVIGTYQKRK